VGRYKDLVDENSVWYHTGGRFLGGLSYPLLGSRIEKERAVTEAKGALEERKVLARLARRENRTALRLHYIDYWRQWQKYALARAFLSDEEGVMRRFRQRSDAGLVLSSETLDALSQYDLARRMAAKCAAAASRDLGLMRLLVRGELPPFRPYLPALETPLCEADRFYAESLEHSPIVAIYRERLARAIESAGLGDYESVESDLRLVGYVNPEFTTRREGDGIEISFNIKLPLSWREAMEGEALEKRARIQEALLALKKESGKELVGLLKLTDLSGPVVYGSSVKRTRFGRMR